MRDLRLTAEDGARLRRRGWRAALVALVAIGSARDTVTRPLAISFTMLGVVGVLLTAAPVIRLGSAAASASQTVGGAAIAAAPEPGASGAATSTAPVLVAPTYAPVRDSGGEPPIDTSTASQRAPTASLPDRSSGTLLLSIGFLVLGFGLFGLRRSARRGGVR
jgi:hypothetical protein